MFDKIKNSLYKSTIKFKFMAKSIMNYTLCVLVLCSCNIFGQSNNSSLSQNTNPKNSIYIELLGKSFIGANVTYERKIREKKGFDVTLLSSFGYTPASYDDMANTYSIGTNLLFLKKRRLSFELGIASSFWVIYNSRMKEEEHRKLAELDAVPCQPPLTYIGYANLGVKYNFKNNWLIRVNAMPFYYQRIKYCTEPFWFAKWGGISIGKSF